MNAAAGGEPAASIGAMALWLTLGAAVLLTLVTVLVLLALRQPRSTPQPRWWLGAGGALLPASVLAGLYAYTALETVRLEPSPRADELVVSITGHQWWWQIRYRDPLGGGDIVTANELHLPAGRPVRLALDSADVIHSFWAPLLAGKRDLLPGRITHLWLRIDRAGLYRGECAEFCGEQHARMPMRVVAHSEDAFTQWLTSQREPAAAPFTELQRRGRQALQDEGCTACHAVRGLTTSTPGGTHAPDLTHLASRSTLAGVLPNDTATLSSWIANAQAIKPGARMASYAHLDAATREAIAAYLAHLR
jgi:cytochrome c oxidase subunit II